MKPLGLSWGRMANPPSRSLGRIAERPVTGGIRWPRPSTSGHAGHRQVDRDFGTDIETSAVEVPGTPDLVLKGVQISGGIVSKSQLAKRR